MNRFLAQAVVIVLTLVLSCTAQTSTTQGIYGSTVRIQDTWFCKKYGCSNNGTYVGKLRTNEDWISFRPDSKKNPGLDKKYREFALGLSRDLQKRLTHLALQTPPTLASRGWSDEEVDYVRDWIKCVLGVDMPWQKIEKAQAGTRDAISKIPKTPTCKNEAKPSDMECIIQGSKIYIMQRGQSNTKPPKTYTIYWYYVYGGGYQGTPVDDWMHIGIEEKEPERI
jgi:hypothetical protein